MPIFSFILIFVNGIVRILFKWVRRVIDIHFCREPKMTKWSTYVGILKNIVINSKFVLIRINWKTSPQIVFGPNTSPFEIFKLTSSRPASVYNNFFLFDSKQSKIIQIDYNALRNRNENKTILISSVGKRFIYLFWRRNFWPSCEMRWKKKTSRVYQLN